MKNILKNGFKLFVLLGLVVFVNINLTAQENHKSFNKIEPKVFIKSDGILNGKFVESDIALIVYDSTKAFEVMVNGKKIISKNGVAFFEENSIKSIDSFERKNQIVEGFIKVGNDEYPFETSYDIYQEDFVISVDSMNFIYEGLHYPINISVPGIIPEKVFVTISNGTIKRKGKTNEYIVLVQDTGEVVFNISAMINDSTFQFIESMKMKVIEIPKLVCGPGKSFYDSYSMFGDFYCSSPKASYIKENPNDILGCLKHFIEIEQVSKKITFFRFTLAKKRGESNPTIEVVGDVLNEECLIELKRLEPGDKIIIDGIKADGPNGKILLALIVINTK